MARKVNQRKKLYKLSIQDGKQQCSKCWEWLPTGRFRAVKKNSTGLDGVCRKCRGVGIRKRFLRLNDKGEYRCSVCKIYKNASCFKRWRGKPRTQCKECMKAIDAASQLASIKDGKQVCATCNIEKELDQFSTKTNKLPFRVCILCRSAKRRNIPDENGCMTCKCCGKSKPLHMLVPGPTKVGRLKLCSDCRLVHIKKIKGKTAKSFLQSVSAVKRHAKTKDSKRRKGFSYEALDAEFLSKLYEQQHGRCAITGVKMTHIRGQGRVATNISVDRIDNSIGYTKENVRLVCYVVNIMRHEMTDDELVVWCKRIIRGTKPSGKKHNTQLALFEKDTGHDSSSETRQPHGDDATEKLR